MSGVSDAVSIQFSVVIPTHNRRDLLFGAVDSVLTWARTGRAEIIIVDDASSDGTQQAALEQYESDLAKGVVRFARLDANTGATGAKNAGAALARGEWIVFLDSDDQLSHDGADAIERFCHPGADLDLAFFRCVTEEGRLIGDAPLADVEVGVKTILAAWLWGECLPVVKTTMAKRWPYEVVLRGHEALTYARMARAGAIVRIAPVVARIYDDRRVDRLSSRTGLQRRACQLAWGYMTILREFSFHMGMRGMMGVLLRIVLHAWRCLKGRAG